MKERAAVAVARDRYDGSVKSDVMVGIGMTSAMTTRMNIDDETGVSAE